MPRPNLLLCFDAFGTLFRPKSSVFHQYIEVARQCGLRGLNDAEVHASLQRAIKKEAKRNPNYGKATRLGATKWWTNVIHSTFTPLLNGQKFPVELAPMLLHRFSTKDGYDVETNLASSIKALRDESTRKRFDRIVVGVITNSDDRVPSVLSSLGVNVSPLRYGSIVDPNLLKQDYDIDFHCISYDVGVEKPDRFIFNAAELMLARIIAIRDGKSAFEAKSDIASWRKVYVGDEYRKDVVGSRDAGWSPVLLHTEEQSQSIPAQASDSIRTVDDLFEEDAVVGVHSIRDLVEWLRGGNPEVSEEEVSEQEVSEQEVSEQQVSEGGASGR